MLKKNLKSKLAVKTTLKGRLYVTATLNNTIVTFSDENGQVLFWGSSGSSGFKGSRKATPYASTVAIESVTTKMKNAGVKQIEVFLKGPGTGRDAVLRVLKNMPFKISQIVDITPLPHNGARQRKARRI